MKQSDQIQEILSSAQMKIMKITGKDAVVNVYYPPKKLLGVEAVIQIQKAVSDICDVPHECMRSESRKAEHVEARAIAIYIIKKNSSLTQKRIGLYFGGRDHSTVIHALYTCKKK